MINVVRFIDINTINLWTTEDLSYNLTRYTPINNAKMTSREMASYLKIIYKSTLTKYPVYSRPVLTKKTF